MIVFKVRQTVVVFLIFFLNQNSIMYQSMAEKLTTRFTLFVDTAKMKTHFSKKKKKLDLNIIVVADSYFIASIVFVP